MSADPSKAADTTEPADAAASKGTSAPSTSASARTAKPKPGKAKPAKAKTAKAKTAKAKSAKTSTAQPKKATTTSTATPRTARTKTPGTTSAATTSGTEAKAASTTSTRPARGAFAAGAARASGERRRRSGTPLIPTAPVEVSAARRLATGAGSDSVADDLIEAAVTEGPTEPESRPARTPKARPARDEAPTRETGAADTDEPVEVADITEPGDPADTLPAEPTPPRTRPSRASMRSPRRAAPGEPARLRAVPPVEDTHARSARSEAEPDTRHTPAGDGGGWEHALTSGLQSRAEKLVGAVLDGAELTSESRPGPAELVELAVNVLRAAATSAGVPAEEVERQVAETLAYLRRRLTGDYVVDEFGFDEDYTVNVHLPLLRPLYRKWFRVEVRGIENIPDVGGALVVGNHSGTVAMDSLMTQVAVYDEHPRNRHLRMLGADLVFQMPFIGTMARRSGTTLAANSDAERLLSGGALVGVWPEGFKGVGKPFSERYKLQRFGRGGFVSAALRAGVPIVPVSIVGAEEIYPILGNMPAVARLLGLPYAPITPTFPLLGPLGMVPLPSKWLIEFGPPIETTSFGPDAADDPMLVFDLTDQVRETIQQTLYSLLMQRKSVFL
ncbi:1-acyl-sn-glycerol-3-phosphate acyltransferase [Terrabacter sp. LjRoot27]|uniref:lysophospholipid acyltransferase family protein n=1 Tax=Terrabacter sp. LjRoot27 TaxID=3342306 RepID=UPI003ED08316